MISNNSVFSRSFTASFTASASILSSFLRDALLPVTLKSPTSVLKVYLLGIEMIVVKMSPSLKTGSDFPFFLPGMNGKIQ
jgi:hypothetical protein